MGGGDAQPKPQGNNQCGQTELGFALERYFLSLPALACHARASSALILASVGVDEAARLCCLARLRPAPR